jgi:hypothetical protein
MEFIKKHIITIGLFLLATVGNYTWNLIQKGGEVEINNTIDKRFTELMMNPAMVKMFLDQDGVKDFAKNQREEAKKEAMKEDEGSVNFETKTAIEMGVRDNQAAKEIGVLYKEWNAFKNQVRNKHELIKM